MTLIRIIFLLCCLHNVSFADTLAESGGPCDKWPSFLKPVCLRPYQTWTQGDNELYLSGYAWHNRHYYDRSRIQNYNEKAFGGGLGKSFYDENGNWHGLFAFAFQDSHKYLEPAAGYAYLKVLHLTDNARVGLGYTVGFTQRPDIFNGIPIVGALPWVSVSYRHLSISGTYIPGSKNVGNVLYVLAKWVI